MAGAPAGDGARDPVSPPAPVRLRRVARPPLSASLAGGGPLAVGLAIPPSGDAPSHLFQTWIFRHSGYELWNNYWYAGRYEFVTYSVFYYPLAAAFGQLAVLVPA